MVDDDHSISRKRKMGNLSDDDLLSDLPLSIIHCILALVPIRDAIRTCILSKQWRYKWASLPHLVFNYECVSTSLNYQGPIHKDSHILRFNKFVTNALLLHQGPIHKFELSRAFLESCLGTDRWLLHLSRSEVRELCIKTMLYTPKSLFRLHSSLYSCRKLTHLHLFRCELASPPLSFKGFSFLRSLVLGNVKLPSNVAVETLVSNSPLLENLTYYSYSPSSEFTISAPNLKCFELRGDFKKIALDAPLVTQVSVSLSKFDSTKNTSVCNYTKFLGGLTNLEKLRSDLFFTKYLSIGIESYDRSLVFHRLKIINLFEVSYHDIKEISVLVHLIMSAPNLHEFSISFLNTEESSEAPPISFSDFGCTTDFTFEKLRIVNIFHVIGVPYEMKFVEYLLECSPVLEKMNFFPKGLKLVPEKILNLTTELLTYGRASPNAKIFVNK